MSKEALLVGEGLRLEDQCYSKRVSGRQGNTRAGLGLHVPGLFWLKQSPGGHPYLKL